MQGDWAVTSRVARWLLLACTVIGLAAMHTLGHGASHTGGHPAAGHAQQPAVVPAGHGTASLALLTATAVGLVDLADGCSGCAHARPGPEPGRHDLPAWSVCLAVLAGLSVAVLLAWLLIGRTTRAGQAAHRAAVRLGASRAPPWPRLGLRLASVSVMRT